jgi:predicted GH43/DUF377 family glycosyl hydrolase
MQYVKVQNGEVQIYPYGISQLKSENPQTSFPKSMTEEMLAEWNIFAVCHSDIPNIDIKTEKVEQASQPVLVNGQWTIMYSAANKTSDEIQEYTDGVSAANRALRNEYLQQTDFYALSDVTMSAEMTAYRQALRDITAHVNWPHLNDDDWPTKP